MLRLTHQAPQILIGHSLGGAAILAAAGQHPRSPRRRDHRGTVRCRSHDAICSARRSPKSGGPGKAEVNLAGPQFRIKREFLEDIASTAVMADVAWLHKALLISIHRSMAP